jgi:hypothetical protein
MSADYNRAISNLQENLHILMDSYGQVAPENQAIWNISNALLVVLDALRAQDAQLTRIEQQLQR